MSDITDITLNNGLNEVHYQTRNLRATKLGLIILGEPDEDESAEMFDLAVTMAEMGTWIKVDLLLMFVEKSELIQIAQRYGYSIGTLRNLVYVGGAWPIENRVLGAPFSWHQTVTPLITNGKRLGIPEMAAYARQWLIDGIELGWTRDDLIEDYRTHLWPPSMREPELPPPPVGIEEDDLTEIVIKEPQPRATYAALRAHVSNLLSWAEEHDAPMELVEPIRRMLTVPIREPLPFEDF